MGALSENVTLTIRQDSGGVQRDGFGTYMILSANASFPERTRTYEDLAGMEDDGFALDGPEYLAAQALASQDPHPTSWKVGRCALPSTIVYVISVVNVLDNHQYQVQVEGEGVTSTLVSAVATDGTATNDEAIALIVTALNLVVGKNYTAASTGSVGSKVCTVTATAAGDWFSLEVDPDLSVAQTHADPGVATDLSAIELYDDDWYSLNTTALGNSNAIVLAAAAWVEARKKIYTPLISDTQAATLAVGGSDTADDLHTLDYSRTGAIYHPSPFYMADAAWNGAVLTIDPGGETWKFKSLDGVPVTALTATHRVNLRAKKCNFYYEVAGGGITADGTTADGNFIDVARGLDWLDDDMSKAVFEVLIGNPKVPYTNAGIAQIEAAVRASLKRAEVAGIVDSGWTVTVPKVADVSAANKSARILPSVKFTATLAGAVHSVTITGIVTA